MAPVTLKTVDGELRAAGALRARMLILHADDLKDVIQHLFEIQSAVHGYLGPETQQELVRKMYVSCNGIPCSLHSFMPINVPCQSKRLPDKEHN